VEEGDAGTGAQIKKSAMRQSSHSFSAANEDSLGQDVWIKERLLQSEDYGMMGTLLGSGR